MRRRSLLFGEWVAAAGSIGVVIQGGYWFVERTWFQGLFLGHARVSLKAGKTPEQALEGLKLPDKFKEYNLTGGRGGPGGNFGVIFEELKGQ